VYLTPFLQVLQIRLSRTTQSHPSGPRREPQTLPGACSANAPGLQLLEVRNGSRCHTAVLHQDPFSVQASGLLFVLAR
jgi:hypothetical protein